MSRVTEVQFANATSRCYLIPSPRTEGHGRFISRIAGRYLNLTEVREIK